MTQPFGKRTTAPALSPLVPDRRAAAGICAAAGAATFLLLGNATDDVRATALDLEVDGLLRPRLEALAPVFERLVDVAAPQLMLLLCVLMSLAALAARNLSAAVLSVVGPAGALLLARHAQEAWDRPSATVLGQGGAYPSGHTAGVVAMLTVVLLLTTRSGAIGSRLNGLRCAALRVFAGCFSCAVVVALVAMRHHYVTDVVGGAAMAASCVVLTALLLDSTSRGIRHGPRPLTTEGARPGAPSGPREGPT